MIGLRRIKRLLISPVILPVSWTRRLLTAAHVVATEVGTDLKNAGALSLNAEGHLRVVRSPGELSGRMC